MKSTMHCSVAGQHQLQRAFSCKILTEGSAADQTELQSLLFGAISTLRIFELLHAKKAPWPTISALSFFWNAEVGMMHCRQSEGLECKPALGSSMARFVTADYLSGDHCLPVIQPDGGGTIERI